MRFRLPVLLALALGVSLAAPSVARADATGPTIDSSTLYNGGVPCSTQAPVPVNDLALQAIQAFASDTQAHQPGLSYTFALWPTADPTAEVDRIVDGSDTAAAIWNGAPLTDGNDYSWRVQATDSNGTSNWSPTCQFHFDNTAPNAPGVTSSNFPPGTWGAYNEPADFTFTSSDPALLGFQYGWGTLPSEACSQASPLMLVVCPGWLSLDNTVAATNGSASVSSLPPSTGPLYFYIRAIDQAGNVSSQTTYQVYNPPLITTPPSVDGTAAPGQTLTATVSDWLPTPTSISFQWLANGSPIAESTALTYVVQPSDVGKSISFAETGVQTNVGTTVENSNSLLIQPLNFAVTPKPTISGTPLVGQVLSALTGAWSPAPTSFAYHWLRNGQPIAGPAALLHAYRLTTADAGAVMSVRVGGVRTGFTTVVEVSAGTAKVLRPLTAASTPAISGVRRYGQVLTAVPGTWGPAPISFSYRWYLGASPIPGATSSRYAPPAAYIGKSMSVVVTGARTGYQSLARRSAAFTIAPGLFTVVPNPRIVGAAQRGATLTASMPATTPAAAGYHYQWRLNNVAIAGQTGARYVVQATDVDRSISVVVTAVRSGYTSVQRASAPTAAVPGQAYPNCAALNAVYPHGVARIGVTGDRVRGVLRPFKGTPFFSNTLYSLNTGRDRDNDGIACEQ